MLKELIGFILGRLSIVTCHNDMDAVRDNKALEFLYLVLYLVCQFRGIPALSLGNGNGHSRPECPRGKACLTSGL